MPQASHLMPPESQFMPPAFGPIPLPPDPRLPHPGRWCRAGGFTLIEILIVVVILGILGAVVLPAFSNASHVSRENVMREDLRFMRAQITAFRMQHRDVCPGFPGGNAAAAPTAELFDLHMTRFTDETCNTNATPDSAFPFGPYLAEVPSNPLTGKRGILVVTGASLPAPDAGGSRAWIYNPQTQKFIANVTGADANGVPYGSY